MKGVVRARAGDSPDLNRMAVGREWAPCGAEGAPSELENRPFSSRTMLRGVDDEGIVMGEETGAARASGSS